MHYADLLVKNRSAKPLLRVKAAVIEPPKTRSKGFALLLFNLR
ncbi:hypothetical protein Hsw_1767 [Hymenobacter swuensis DY53]|uniref:Uncharacterized protein n=1 Tax=Hymenobacter swuensis DY53 TaxID=1227739 RepID=W8F028_9BACT|nr:hypothetical protein Hsw_1767 [Hymenobacter swuensis DY53]